MRSIKIVFLFSLFFSVGAGQASAKNEFPARKLYPAVPYITLDALYRERAKVIIVDVRSSYEYETLRIKGALNISVSSTQFVANMRKLRAKNPQKKIVVYCNGKTCKKSYKAVQKCRDKKIANVIAYDAGIMDWAKKYPQASVLLGKSPINPARIIAKASFKKKLVEPKMFDQLAARNDVIILDVRDPFQREGLGLFPGNENRAYLDDAKAIEDVIDKAKSENKILLVYDEAGKQVRWLMYSIEKKGLTNYRFMKGGASAYFAVLRKEFLR